MNILIYVNKEKLIINNLYTNPKELNKNIETDNGYIYNNIIQKNII